MNHAADVVMHFTAKGADEVFFKALGKFINRVVGVFEVGAKRVLKNRLTTKNIDINSEEFINLYGK